VTTELGGRAQRDTQVSYELRRGTKRVTFGDVGWNRERSPSHLIDQSEVSIQGSICSQAISRLAQVVSRPPGIEGLELSHRANVRGVPTNAGITIVRTVPVSRTTFPVSRVPFPVSRV